MTRHHDLYYAIAEALARGHVGGAAGAEESAALEHSAVFVREQLAALPLRLRALARLGLLTFRIAVRLRYLRGFCGLPLARRRAVVDWWAFGPIATTRKLFRPIRSTALLAYYERVLRQPCEPAAS